MRRIPPVSAVASLVIFTAFFGCGQSRTFKGSPYVAPPPMAQIAEWGDKLPRGIHRFQKPSRIGLVVTEERIASSQLADIYLKEELKKALGPGGQGDLRFHYYIDGMGKIFKGRDQVLEAPRVGDFEQGGMVWIAFMDNDMNLIGDGQKNGALVHLLTYLCFTHEIEPESIVLTATGTDVASSRLYRDLDSPYLIMLVRKTLDNTREETAGILTAPQWDRTQRLRIHESSE